MTIADDLAAAVATAQADAAKLNAVVHGPSAGPTSLVATDAGLVKTLARITAEAAAAAGAGVVPFSPPVPWTPDITAVIGPPATAVTFEGESYFCNTGHLTGATFAEDAAKWTKLAQKGADGTVGLVRPGGRLTLITGDPEMAGEASGVTTLRYAPWNGDRISIWDGTHFTTHTFGELSNVLANSATGKAGPAALLAHQVADAFVWDDAGAKTLTRGAAWIKQATVTMTIASPCVVTWTAHGLKNGDPVKFTTDGALPTGVTAGTNYFASVINANSFNICTSISNQIVGTLINTSVSQSGTHTATNHTTSRGTGAGTAELERLNGVWVNKHDITNGPAARRGTFVGSIGCEDAVNLNHFKGLMGSGGIGAVLCVWNFYNRLPVAGFWGPSDNTWTHSTTTWRPVLNQFQMRVRFLCGIPDEPIVAEGVGRATNASVSVNAVGLALNDTVAPSPLTMMNPGGGIANVVLPATCKGSYLPRAGWNYVTLLERADGVGTTTWQGDNNTPTMCQTGLSFRWRF
ncbi:MAG: hypothetical protein Q8M03_17340 [Legionella sp.]|nr:hypothetical protein [Legionella sp.]